MPLLVYPKQARLGSYCYKSNFFFPLLYSPFGILMELIRKKKTKTKNLKTPSHVFCALKPSPRIQRNYKNTAVAVMFGRGWKEVRVCVLSQTERHIAFLPVYISVWFPETD